jgi:hypothetical protein
MKAKHWQKTDANFVLINIISDINGTKWYIRLVLSVGKLLQVAQGINRNV